MGANLLEQKPPGNRSRSGGRRKSMVNGKGTGEIFGLAAI
jgi:hypothetical protein